MKAPLYIFITLVLLLVANTGFSQIKPMYTGHWDEILVGFEYNNVVYKKNPKYLKKFISETEMSIQLKTELLNQTKSIKTKRIIANSLFYSSLGVASYLIINSVSNNSNISQDAKTDKLQQGAINAVYSLTIGSVLNWIIKPKKKHYHKFFSTFNNKSTTSADYNIKIDYTQQFNFGIQITF